jgi:hypothetical protein
MALPCHSVLIEKVSAESLPKTGIFPISAGDFRQILPLIALFRSLETSHSSQESPHFRGFSLRRCKLCQPERVAGWRRSAHRTRLS